MISFPDPCSVTFLSSSPLWSCRFYHIYFVNPFFPLHTIQKSNPSIQKCNEFHSKMGFFVISNAIFICNCFRLWILKDLFVTQGIDHPDNITELSDQIWQHTLMLHLLGSSLLWQRFYAAQYCWPFDCIGATGSVICNCCTCIGFEVKSKKNHHKDQRASWRPEVPTRLHFNFMQFTTTFSWIWLMLQKALFGLRFTKFNGKMSVKVLSLNGKIYYLLKGSLWQSSCHHDRVIQVILWFLMWSRWQKDGFVFDNTSVKMLCVVSNTQYDSLQ